MVNSFNKGMIDNCYDYFISILCIGDLSYIQEMRLLGLGFEYQKWVIVFSFID